MDSVKALTAETKYRLLLQISQKISGTLDLDEILNHILDTVRTTVEYDAAGIFVLTREDPYLRYGHPAQLIAGMAARGFPTRPAEHDPMLRSGKGIIGHVIRTGTCVVAPDVRRDPYYVDGRALTLSEIAVPNVLDQRTIGALNLESDTVGAYSDGDVETLRFFAAAAAISIERAMLHRQLLEKRRIESQLQIARDVQSRLLPESAPGLAGYDIAGISIPTFEIGGDYFDYIRLADDRLGVVVADVAGKGIPAALIMATFRALVRSLARNETGLPHIMQSVNRLLAEATGLPAFVTSVFGVLDAAAGLFSYANCGHNPPVVVRRDAQVEDLKCGGPLLGAFDEVHYEAGEVLLESGDVLVLYTDGVVDTLDSLGGDFGVDRLVSVVHRSRQQPASEIIRALVRATRDFSGTPAYQDDFTLVIIRRE